MIAFDARPVRRAANLLARSPANRRLEVARQLGAPRALERDVLWDVVEAHRDLDGVTYERRMAPLGLVGVVEPDIEVVVDLLVAGNAVVAKPSTGRDSCDFEAVRRQLSRVGLPSDVVCVVEELPATEIDALMTADRDVLLAERVGTHSHVYVDERAPIQHVTFLCMNALSSATADTIVFHQGFSDEGRHDVEVALTATGTDAEVLSVESRREAIELIDMRSSGRAETILTEDLPAAWDFTAAVDASAVVLNCSPKFAATVPVAGERVGMLRTRWVLTGDGQTSPLETEAAMPTLDVPIEPPE